MKSFLTIFFINILFCACNSSISPSKKVNVELYVAPKVYSCNLYIDKGIFNYPLKKCNLFTTRENSCYVNSSIIEEKRTTDSVITMFYTNFQISIKEFRNYFQDVNKTAKDPLAPFQLPRALIITHFENKSDTILMYDTKDLMSDLKYYKMIKPLDSIFTNSLPEDLKLNWK